MLASSNAGDQIAGAIFVVAAIWAIVRLRRSNRSLRKYETLARFVEGESTNSAMRQGLDNAKEPPEGGS